MRALLVAMLALVVGACASDIDEPWVLNHDRIIAVRAEPPRIEPGQQSRLELLRGFDNEEAPTDVKAPDFAQVISPMSLADTMAPDGGNWLVTAPSAERLAAARAELMLADDAPVPVRVAVASAWPYPVMSPDERGFGALKTVWLGATAQNPPLVSLMINGVEAPPEGEEIVVPAGTATDPVKIPLYVEADDSTEIVNWLTSCGVMHDFDLHSAYLTVAPEDPQAGQLAVVLRDAHGGVTWRVWPIRAE